MDYTASLMSQGVKINPACIHRARTLLFPLSSPHERLRAYTTRCVENEGKTLSCFPFISLRYSRCNSLVKIILEKSHTFAIDERSTDTFVHLLSVVINSSAINQR